MIALFGAPGSGKSLQGQLLAARHDWRWLSTGQILRDSKDPAILAHIKDGQMIGDEIILPLLQRVIHEAKDINGIILDGFPRTEEQVKWMLDPETKLSRDLKLVIHLMVSDEELDRRLNVRGRVDDGGDERAYRQEFYSQQVDNIFKIFDAHDIDVIHVNGEGSVGSIHDRIEEVLDQCSLV